jgi:WS/DGAT/MGAT family acyltransferase
VAVAGPGSLRDVLDLAQPIAKQAFDKDRPLWELYQVDGLQDGRTAIVIKLHHAVTDGVGLLRMTTSLVERSREPRPPREGPGLSVLEEAPAERGPFAEAVAALRHRGEVNLDRSSRALSALQRGAADALRHPGEALQSATRLIGSVGRSLRPVSEPMSPVMTGRSLGVHFEVFSLSLEELKRPAKAIGGTLNDAFVAAVCGGMRLYHEHHGKRVAELRMTMPVNLRDGEEGNKAGNKFAPARFAVPVGIADPSERMRVIRDSVLRERAEPALPLIDDVAGIIGRLPRVLSVRLFGSMLKAIDIVTSNVPGPPSAVYASGARVEQMFGFGPLSGSAANITLFSYDGRLYCAINTDPAAVPDPELFRECLERGVAEVLTV